jgi:hypothetical protein
MYFIKRKVEYNRATVKKKLSQANHTTKSRNKKRRKPIETDPDELTMPVKRQPVTAKGKTQRQT